MTGSVTLLEATLRVARARQDALRSHLVGTVRVLRGVNRDMTRRVRAAALLEQRRRSA